MDMHVHNLNIGTVVGSTSPVEFRFHLKRLTAKLGDLVTVETSIPGQGGDKQQEVLVWGRITGLHRFNPFLPAEATVELADEGIDLTDTVLSSTRDQVEGTVLILGKTSRKDLSDLAPLNYPVQPGAIVRLPGPEDTKKILQGESEGKHRLRVGTLIGRDDVDVSLETNVIVARHMAILAMTGGGKTVASRQIIKGLLESQYPTVILDPHGDYLGFWEKQNLFPDINVRLFYPNISVNEQNRGLISYLVEQMTQGFTDPQRDIYSKASEDVTIPKKKDLSVPEFIDRVLAEVDGAGGGAATRNAVKRGLRFVANQMRKMDAANKNLRTKLKEYPFAAMPDPFTCPEQFVRPGQLSVIYLGGYDHITQSTIVSLVLQNLFDSRASMGNSIPPFLTVVEEAHNFIPSRGEGQAETPSVEIIRKVITEGRKFGVGLMLISQRPSRLDETTLSQCNTFLVLRLVNPRDQSFVEKVMENLSKADGRLLPGFGRGEGIVSGQAVRFPLLVKVDFDERLVSKSIGDENFIELAQTWSESTEAKMSAESDEILADLKSAED